MRVRHISIARRYTYSVAFELQRFLGSSGMAVKRPFAGRPRRVGVSPGDSWLSQPTPDNLQRTPPPNFQNDSCRVGLSRLTFGTVFHLLRRKGLTAIAP